MIRTGWVISGLTSVFVIGDGLAKALFPPTAFLLEEIQRLGERESTIVPFAILYLACAVVYLIPRTTILGAILLTGYLGGAEAIQSRVSGSGPILLSLPVILGVLVWAGVWLRDERLRNLIPLRARSVRAEQNQ